MRVICESTPFTRGDLDGVKGVCHINAVDEVTQWQVIGATEKIWEAWLQPVPEAILEQVPFQIRGFHSDNGSAFVNHTVAALLNKLLIEQTKSRARHSNDNGLVETWKLSNERRLNPGLISSFFRLISGLENARTPERSRARVP